MKAKITITPVFTIPSEDWPRPQPKTFNVQLPTVTSIHYNAASLAHDIALCYIEAMPCEHEGWGVAWNFKIEFI